ncbi:hypothetical protein [Amycolatopsis jejuensis]|uniref:hypothetical protein n=1 Tax=Amycolatopsis jejuensis TaxID=330084 RepID=UPI000524854D|nr:hypothetical protein [Amycolatopsis jejuensis]
MGRIARHSAAATGLALLSDHQLARLLDAAPVVAVGIGGTAVRLDVAGVPVFAKRVPLTDLERRPENVRSTANVFDLPTFCHYGLGSAGGGVWRELAAHVMTTGWVLSGECAHFPLLYHWRELPMPRRTPDLEERERSVEFWHGSPAVRRRLELLDDATSSVVLFLEYLPTTVHEWLRSHLTDAAWIETQLLAVTDFLAAQGLLHFDAHFGNILTDGKQIYLADFGLALSTRFDLTPAERAFATRNAAHDRGYVVTQLVNWLVTELAGTVTRAERVAYVRRGEFSLPEPASSIVKRHARTAMVMNEFYDQLMGESRETPFPAR